MSSGGPIGEVGELGVLADLRRVFGELASQEPSYLGIGDDAALLPVPGADRQLVATVDALVEGVHFERRYAPARLVGRKALAVNLSDVAAMGGIPRYALCALLAPPDLSLSWVHEFAQGFGDRAREFGVRIVGGNLSRGPCFAATVTVLGEVERGRAVTRDGGRPGDRLYVTGTLGASALGMALLRDEGPRPSPEVQEALTRAHLDPTPRLAEGRLAAGFARAMIDLSDGLVADLGHLCRASGCGAEVQAARLPWPREAEALATALWGSGAQAALTGGEDYELLCAVPEAQAQAFELAVGREGLSFQAVGRLTAGPGIEVVFEDGRREAARAQAFEHFR
jgi:thiamine-monophosphate kinase